MTAIPLIKAIELLLSATAVVLVDVSAVTPNVYDTINIFKRARPDDDEEVFLNIYRSQGPPGSEMYFLFDDNHKVVLDGNTMHLIERESGDIVALTLLAPTQLELVPAETVVGVPLRFADIPEGARYLRKDCRGQWDRCVKLKGDVNGTWNSVYLDGLFAGGLCCTDADAIVGPGESDPPTPVTPPDPPVARTTEDNYIQEFWWMQKVMGNLSDILLVNASRHNAVTPAQCGLILDQMIARVAQFRAHYAAQHTQTAFNIERFYTTPKKP
jgi:hypothetical protein